MTLASATLAATGFEPNQPVQVREGDTWSAATVLKREGRRYLVHYANSDATSDEWVSPDRVRSPGAAASADSTAPAQAPAEPAPPRDEPSPTPAPRRSTHDSAAAKHEMFPEPDDLIPQTEPDRSAIDQASPLESSPQWLVKLDPTTRPAAPRTYTLRSRGGMGRDLWIKQLLPCAGGGAVIGFSDFGEKVRFVQRVGAIASAARAALAAQSFPLAASPDGSLLVCRCNAFGFGNNARIDAYHLNSSSTPMTPFVSFTPYPPENADEKGEDVRYAAALSNTRIVTCDAKGRLIAWDIKPNAVVGVWEADLGRIRYGGFGSAVVLSPGGKWFAGAGENGLAFVDSADGKTLGMIPCSQHVDCLACSPTGSTLLATGEGSLTSFDVATGQATRTVALPDKMIGQMTCPADGFALFGGDRLVDATTGTVVTSFKPPLQGMTLAETGPGVTLVATVDRMVAARIPDAATLKSTAGSSAALALKPGMSVAVDINVDMSAADKAAVDAAIRKKLVADGFVIDPSADTKVICRTEPGAAHEHYFAKTQFGMPVMIGTGGTSVIINDKVTRCTIEQSGKTIWERKRSSGPAGSFKLNDGQSLEDGARATVTYDPQFLIGLQIPAYIAKPQ